MQAQPYQFFSGNYQQAIYPTYTASINEPIKVLSGISSFSQSSNMSPRNDTSFTPTPLMGK